MSTDQRARLDRALDRARRSAYPPGEYVGQESFTRASEILALATAAGIGHDSSVLDLCCGVAGPGRFITRELGCAYVGLDASAAAIDLARERAHGTGCRFEVAYLPPVPTGPFDAVLLLETMLAFRDKESLVRQVGAALRPGGRFAFTLEAGRPLTPAERERMPAADTVWPMPFAELVELLDRAGLQVRWQQDCTGDHREVVDALVAAFVADRRAIVAQIGRRALEDLLAAHRLWSRWLGEGRVRKLAVVAETAPPPGHDGR